jgi:hypothetical protein
MFNQLRSASKAVNSVQYVGVRTVKRLWMTTAAQQRAPTPLLPAALSRFDI